MMRKVRVADQIARLVQHLSTRQLEPFKLRLQTGKILRLYGRQKPVRAMIRFHCPRRG